MSKFVIRRSRDGKYVAARPNTSSYTKRLEEARVWPSREAAQAECCDDERVLDACSLIGGAS